MPRYNVVRDCYGFMERYWEQGTTVDISNPPVDLPRHFELVALLPGEKQAPPRKIQPEPKLVFEFPQEKQSESAAIADLRKQVQELKDLLASMASRVPIPEDIIDAPEDGDGLSEDLGDVKQSIPTLQPESAPVPQTFSSPETGLTAVVIPPTPEPVEITSADGTTVKVVVSKPEQVVKVDAQKTEAPKGPKVVNVVNKAKQ